MTASCNSVTLRWIEPVSDGGLPVTKYSIQMKDDIGAVVYSGTVIPPATTYRHVNNIKRQACYHVEVRAHNAFDKSEAVDVSVTTKSFCECLLLHSIIRGVGRGEGKGGAGADPGEVKWVNFHPPPFSEPPSFFFYRSNV